MVKNTTSLYFKIVSHELRSVDITRALGVQCDYSHDK
jgi:hypothetical protein